MKHDLTTGTWQDDTGCPIIIILVTTSDWIHHWVLLQFVHPSFSVPCKTDLNEKHPDGVSVYNFKHESWNQFIRAMDDELVTKYFDVHQEYPRFGIVWIGTQIMPVF